MHEIEVNPLEREKVLQSKSHFFANPKVNKKTRRCQQVTIE